MSLPIVPVGGTYVVPDNAIWRTKCPTAPNVPIMPGAPGWDGSAYRFDVPGIYYWQGYAGAHGFVLCYGNDAFANARIVFDLIVNCTYYLGCADECVTFNLDIAGYTEDMLLRPRMHNLGCGQQNNAAIVMLAEMGIPGRIVQWVSLDPRIRGHLGLEIKLPEDGWTTFDVFYGTIFRAGWDALDVFNHVQAGGRPQDITWYFQETLEGPEWTLNEAAEDVYSTFDGGVGFGVLPASVDYPMYLGADATLEIVQQHSGMTGANMFSVTEEQMRGYWYADEST